MFDISKNLSGLKKMETYQSYSSAVFRCSIKEKYAPETYSIIFVSSISWNCVLLVGTLNRVMIVELGVPSSLVMTMVAIPLVRPFRALIGFRSDTHKSAIGWKEFLIYGWKTCFCSEG